MPKEEWGVKRVCPTTGKRFYDLNKTPIISPYTGEVVTLESGGKGRGAHADKAEKKSASVVDHQTDDDAVLDDDADVDLGDDVLEDDDDDSVALDDLADVSSEDDDEN